MRVVRHIVLALVLALPVAAAEMPSVQVVEPADHATLAGGSTAVIRWTGSAAARDIEEWEAFLSVDGGRYYCARITPHLDVAIREFRWTVPNVASNDVRILLRFGNEKDERAIELPLALSIRPAELPQEKPQRTFVLGEAARPGDPGVALWAEGDRDGTRVVFVASSAPGITARAHRGSGQRSAVEAAGRVVHPKPARNAFARVALRHRADPALVFSTDVLLRCRRLNI